MKIEYLVVASSNVTEFENVVAQSVADGYDLVGGVSVCIEERWEFQEPSNVTVYHQAVKRTLPSGEPS